MSTDYFTKKVQENFIFYIIYNYIIRENLWLTLAFLGIPKKLIALIQMCNAENYSKIKFKNVVTHTFKIENELHQEDAMSVI